MKPKQLNLNFDIKGRPFDVMTREQLLSEVLEGRWSSLYKGKGLEFSGFRAYVYGDDASFIDWKATRRAGKTLVRVYTQDRSARVFLVLDVGDSMLFSSRKDGKMKVEYAAELVYKMANSILKSGDAVGLLMLSDKIVARLEPNIGPAVIHKIKNELLKPKNYGGKFDFLQAMKLLISAAGEKVVIILLSDFIGLNHNWEKYVQILNQKYDFIGVMIKDHRDRYLPATGGQIILQDPSSNEKIFIDSSQYSKLYHQEVLKEEEMIMKKFKAAKASLLRLETTDDGFLKIIQFFNKRVVLQSVK